MDIEKLQRGNEILNRIQELRYRSTALDGFDACNIRHFESLLREAIALGVVNADELADKVRTALKVQFDSLQEELKAL